MSEIVSYVRVSELPTAESIATTLSLLAINNINGYIRNEQIPLSSISSNIYNNTYSNAVATANNHANDLCASLSTKVDTLLTSINTAIAQIRDGASEFPSLTAVLSRATMCASISDDTLSGNLIERMDAISTSLSNSASSYVDDLLANIGSNAAFTSIINPISTGLSDSLTALQSNFNNFSSEFNTTYKPKITYSETAITNINTAITNINTAITNLKSAATDSELGMVKIGYQYTSENPAYCPLMLDDDGKAYAYVPGGGSGGGGLTPDQANLLTCLALNLGENCEKYITNINDLGSSIDSINSILNNNSKLLNLFTCYNDKKHITKNMYDADKYQVVMIPVDYSYKYASQFFIVPAAPDSDPYKYCRKIYINAVTEVSAMLLSSVDSTNIHYATEFSGNSSYTLKADDGTVVETSAASDLNEYDIVVRVQSLHSLEPLEVRIVKNISEKQLISIYDASNKEAALLKLGSNVVPDSDNEDLYISYVDINYSILEKFNEINLLYGYSTVNIAENTSILIPANLTKLIKIDTPQYQEYFAFSVKSFNTTDNDIDLIQASVFSDKAYLTLFNNSTNDKTIQEASNITIELLYLKKEYVHRINL